MQAAQAVSREARTGGWRARAAGARDAPHSKNDIVRKDYLKQYVS
jgi:hypothetical protein